MIGYGNIMTITKYDYSFYERSFIMLSYMPYIWIILAVVFMVIEATTVQMVSVWFAISAIITTIISTLKVPIVVQITVFVIVAVLLLIFTRPFVKKYLNLKKQRTNADRVLEQIGKVTEEIDNVRGTGRVMIDGLLWTARAKDNTIIPIDTEVKVERIDGVKLFVSKASLKVES